MEAFFIYLGKMMVCSATMFIYYHWFLKDKTFHHYNRFYLLATVVISLLLPLLKLSYFTVEVNKDLYLLLSSLQNFNSAKNLNHDFTYFEIAVFTFGLVSVFLLARLLYGVFKIQKLKSQFPKENFEGFVFYQTNLSDAPFSFFKNLFWKKSIELQSDLGRQILKHEMVHIEQKHSIDKLFIQIVKSLFWFNPVFYFIKKEIDIIHEYLADHKAVQKSDTQAFAQMLLASHFSGNSLPATSPFLSSNLKKRLKMITKTKTKYSYARKILALPILFVISLALLVNAKNREIKKQNKEIAMAVQQLKKDTLKPSEVQNFLQVHREKLNKASDKIRKEDARIRVLSEETRKKAEELQKIAKEKGTNSYEYELKTKEIETLGNEIDYIANSDSYTKNIEIFEKSGKELEHFFNSDEFKKQFQLDEEKMKELEKNLDSKNFKSDNVKIMKFRFPDQATFEVPKIPDVPNIPDYQLPMMTFENFDWIKNSNLSKQEIKKLEKLAKERAQVSKKLRDLAKKQAELSREHAEITNQKKMSFNMKFPNKNEMSMFDNGDSRRIVIRTKGNMNLGGIDDNTKIYINGKLATKKDIGIIKSDEIATINVSKNKENGKENNEIRIQTK